MKTIIPVFFFLLLALPSFGQLRKVIHTTFDTEQAATIQFDFYSEDEYEVELWAGDNIMTETTIKLYEGSAGILNHFTGAGRYEIESTLEGETLKMTSKDKERRPIKTKEGECFEQVKHKIFLPDMFEKGSDDTWNRAVEARDKITKDN